VDHGSIHRVSSRMPLRSLLARPYGLSRSGLLLKLAIVATLVSSHSSIVALAQPLPCSKEVMAGEIIQKPALELARSDFAIIRWTTNTPGGSDEHFGVVHYGTDRNHLSQTAKSHVRLNRGHRETIFRVRLIGLEPLRTYYYRVTSMDGSGKTDGKAGAVSQFVTPGPGESLVAFPPQAVSKPGLQ
jgi:Purple acid Phosphatase, N-terminal domain